jgi:hypothetical protein
MGLEILWSTNPKEYNLNLPFWPNLTNLSVEYSPITPSGERFFEREPGQAVDNDGDNAYDFLEDDENNYPEHMQIPLEDHRGACGQIIHFGWSGGPPNA